jgi:hypothetical protein
LLQERGQSSEVLRALLASMHMDPDYVHTDLATFCPGCCSPLEIWNYAAELLCLEKRGILRAEKQKDFHVVTEERKQPHHNSLEPSSKLVTPNSQSRMGGENSKSLRT